MTATRPTPTSVQPHAADLPPMPASATLALTIEARPSEPPTTIDGVPVKVQVGLNMTIVDSKEAA